MCRLISGGASLRLCFQRTPSIMAAKVLSATTAGLAAAVIAVAVRSPAAKCIIISECEAWLLSPLTNPLWNSAALLFVPYMGLS
jgi:hypothetical protein